MRRADRGGKRVVGQGEAEHGVADVDGAEVSSEIVQVPTSGDPQTESVAGPPLPHNALMAGRSS